MIVDKLIKVLKEKVRFIETCIMCGKVILRPYIANRSEQEMLCKKCASKEHNDKRVSEGN